MYMNTQITKFYPTKAPDSQMIDRGRRISQVLAPVAYWLGNLVKKQEVQVLI